MGTGSFSGGEYDLTMRLSLFVLGIFAAIVCIASPASAQYLLMTIGQFPFITEKISEQALIKTALVLLPRPLQTSPGPSDLGW